MESIQNFFFMVIVIIIIITFIFIIRGMTRHSNKNSMLETLKNIEGFEPSKYFMGRNGATGISYDAKRKTICLINNSLKYKLYSHRDILSSEILKNGVSTTKVERSSQIGGALIGGLVLGPVGMLIGGLSGQQETTEEITSVDLQIVVNDLSKPRFVINFSAYTIDEVREWQAILDVLIKRADKEDNMNKFDNQHDSSDMFLISNELEKLAKLRDAKVLTESEFEQQKTKLLNHR